MRSPAALTDDVKKLRHASTTCRPGRPIAWQVRTVLPSGWGPDPAIAAIDTSVSLGFSVTASADATPVAFLDLAGDTRAGKWVNLAADRLARDPPRPQRACRPDRNLVIGGVGARLVDW